ncbi:MAG TPA: hypothetical protein VFF30_18145 [Nitrososphaerales archaeon]|nr:hypothetical protein [Nitrososphaerales archaeon]
MPSDRIAKHAIRSIVGVSLLIVGIIIGLVTRYFLSNSTVYVPNGSSANKSSSYPNIAKVSGQ